MLYQMFLMSFVSFICMVGYKRVSLLQHNLFIQRTHIYRALVGGASSAQQNILYFIIMYNICNTKLIREFGNIVIVDYGIIIANQQLYSVFYKSSITFSFGRLQPWDVQKCYGMYSRVIIIIIIIIMYAQLRMLLLHIPLIFDLTVIIKPPSYCEE